MNKAVLRKIYQEKREALNPAMAEELSIKICSRFFENFSLQEVRNLHVFLPIARRNEVNTWHIIRKLQKDYPQAGIIISRTDWKNRKMENYHLAKDTIIETSPLGIPEPTEGTLCPAEKIDLVLLPLLAFDLSGNRVGYGAGFYDRFLASCNPKATKAGLSLFDPVPEKISGLHEHDVPMDACICPDRVYNFK